MVLKRVGIWGPMVLRGCASFGKLFGPCLEYSLATEDAILKQSSDI